MAQLGNSAAAITVPGTIINDYTSLTADAAAGTSSLSVASNVLNTSNRFGAVLGAQDLLLIIQMQGAGMDVSDTNAYGNVGAYNSAGRYEIVEVASVSGTGTINLSCSLQNSYAVNGRVQVVRIPRYLALTINAGASVTAPAWNGSTGGVVAARVQGNTVINGTIDVSGLGFRGGAVDNSSDDASVNVTDYRGGNPTFGGEKGESIVGYQTVYDGGGGRFGRGAPANGGGGGNSHNAAGGGGANAGLGAWTGTGLPNRGANNVFDAAWNLESLNFATSTSSGGGRGGYSYASNNGNALTQGPGNSAWGGNQRRNGGGLGGRPLDTRGRLFFGGGGGAGDGNNSGATSGGNGGGLILLLAAGNVSGTGSLVANGGSGSRAGGITTANGQDAGGGGGGGGTIVLNVEGTITSVTATATGGTGNSQAATGTESEGPGGGGGGGLLLFTNAGTGFNGFVSGGANGTTSSPSLTEFPQNGATAGANGLVRSFLYNPQCAAADVTTTIAASGTTFFAGQPGGFDVTFRNTSTTIGANDVIAQVQLPAGLSNVSVSNGGTYDVATGIVSYPAVLSLLPGQIVSSFISFTNPVTALVTASSRIETTTAQGFSPNTNPNPDQASASLVITSLADVTTSLSGPAAADRNDLSGTYTATFTNNGPSTAADVAQTVTLPAGATVTAAQLPAGATVSTQGTGASAVRTINFGTAASLAAGASNSFGFSFTTPNVNGNVNLTSSTGTSTRQDASNPAGPGASPDSFTLPINLTNTASDLSVTVAASAAAVLAGQPGQFTVTFANNGSNSGSTTGQVQLPAGLTIGANLSAGWTYNPATGLVTFTAGSFALNTGATRTLVIPFTAPVSGTVTATATINSSSVFDNNQANNTASAGIDITPAADLQTTLSGPLTADAGTTVNYTATVTNLGPATATGINTTVQLVRGLFNVTGGSYNFDTGLLTLAPNQTLSNGESQSFLISFSLPNNNQPVDGRASSTASTADAVASNNNGTASTAAVLTAVVLPQGACAGTTPSAQAATQGLFAEYYNAYHAENVSTFFSTRTANLTRTEGRLDFGSTTWGNIVSAIGNGTASDPNQYTARMQGVITIATGGTYTFTLLSDDGSYLWLGNVARETPLSISRATVNNGGQHAAQTASNTLQLAAGSYPLVLVFGEAGGSNVLTLTYSGPDTGGSSVVVPQSVLCSNRLAETPLPVTLTRFEAKARGNDARLTWETAQEKNNRGFVVERSTDGRRFEAVGEVAGHGTTAVAQRYSYTDAGAARFGGTVYYRLQQLDTDGTATYTPVQAVDFGQLSEPLLYPNPTTEHLQVRLPAASSPLVGLAVYSTLGQLLLHQEAAPRLEAKLNVSTLPSGTYLLRLRLANGQTLIRRFVKQ
ncbi:hypothetical protein GCM10027048_24550 [Hymenobacter coalescens]